MAFALLDPTGRKYQVGIMLRIGRNPANEIILQDPQASQFHATLAEHQGGLLLRDENSTNGTFVTLNGYPELVLHKETCVLHGKGIICFAASAHSPEADWVEFEQF